MKNITLSLKNVFSGGAKNIALTIISVIAAGIIYQYKDALQEQGLIGDILLYVLGTLTTLGALTGFKKPINGGDTSK